MLDAFDFFVMALVLDDVAKSFATSRTVLSWAITLTLALRPLGALVFGRLADRFGRRRVLMANVVCYSALAALSGFAPSLMSFLVARALFGVAMGGEWGVGASLTMESIPSHWRGPVSGLLQAGYPCGFLLATLAYHFAAPWLGWRGMFVLGALPALLVLYVRRHVPESPAWVARNTGSGPASAFRRAHLPRAAYAVAMMTGFTFFSHGTQDIFPSFLKREHGFSHDQVTGILVAMNCAAILGGLVCGALSQRFGRRRVIAVAALLALPVIPAWAFGSSALTIAIAAFCLQLCVQGAWGVVPAHLNELSPAELRATFPGVTYQLGNFLAAGTVTIQTGLAERFFDGALNWPLALMVGITAALHAAIVGFGPEARQADLTG